MANSTTVEIDIDNEGNASIHVQGHQGSSCRKHLEAFKELGVVTSEGLKPEYHKPEINQNRILNTTHVGNR